MIVLTGATTASGCALSSMRNCWPLLLLTLSGCLELFARPSPAPVPETAASIWRPGTTFDEYNPSADLLADQPPGEIRVATVVKVDDRYHQREIPIYIVARRDGKEVMRQQVAQPKYAPEEGDLRKVEANLRFIAGDYVFEVVEQGIARESAHFRVGGVPCYGGRRRWEVHRSDAGLHFGFENSANPSRLRVPRWERRDEDPAYIVEWRRDGKLEKVEQGRASKAQELVFFVEHFYQWPRIRYNQSECLWDHGAEEYQMPDKLLASPGSWEVQVHRERQPPLAFHFEVRDGAIAGLTEIDGLFPLEPTEIAAPPEMARRLAKIPQTKIVHGGARPPLIPGTSAELRALARSPELCQEVADIQRLAGVTVQGGSVSESDLSTSERALGPQAQHDLVERRRASNADGASDIITRGRRKAAGKKGRVLAHIKALSQPWRPDEHPSAAPPGPDPSTPPSP